MTRLLLAAAIGLAAVPAQAQLSDAQAAACGCDHVQPNTGNTAWVLDGDAVGVQPGDRVCLAPEQRTLLTIRNVHGTEAAPVTVANCGGKAVIEQNGRGSYGLRVVASSHLRLTGTGNAAHTHGIEVRGVSRTDAPTMGLAIGGLTRDIEADHLEIHRVGFAGIMAKSDPTCDRTSWRENFHMGKVHLHHNHIYETGGEGFYVGYFRSAPFEMTCGGQTVTAAPHLIDPLLVHDNEVHDTDADGIQVSNAPGHTRIYRNTVRRYGVDPFERFQNSGFQIGGGTAGLVYDNVIDTGSGTGIGVFGTGRMVVFNNVVANAGELGVFADERDPSPGPGAVFAHNTIVSPGSDAFRLYTDRHEATRLVNNLIVAPGGQAVRTLSGDVTVVEAGNVIVDDLAAARFAAPDDYHLEAASPATDAGASMDGLGTAVTYFGGVTADLDGAARVQGSAPDAGAYERPPGVVIATPSEAPGMFALRVGPSPVLAGGAVRVRVTGAAGPVQLEVLDALGRRVEARTLPDAVADLRLGVPGVYLVRAEGAAGVVSARLVVVR